MESGYTYEDVEDEVFFLLQKFNKSSVVSQILTPKNLSVERERLRAGLANNKFLAPTFQYQEVPNALSDAVSDATNLLRSIKPLSDNMRETLEQHVSNKLLLLEAAVSHNETELTSATSDLYGVPSKKLIEFANGIVNTDYKHEDAAQHFLGAEEVVLRFEAFTTSDFFAGWEVLLAEHMHSKAAVNSGNKTVKIRLGASFSEHELERLLIHELGTHALRTTHSKKQKTKIFFTPLGVNEITEEGLALYNEDAFGKLSLSDLRKYALRVIAADKSLREPFSEVLKFLKLHTSADEAIDIAIRAKRGFNDPEKSGSYLKDICYLAGYLEISQYLQKNPEDYGLLMSVKQPLQMLPILKEALSAEKIDLWPGGSAGGILPGPDGPLTSGESKILESFLLERNDEVVWREKPLRSYVSGSELSAVINSNVPKQAQQALKFTNLNIQGDINLEGMRFSSPIEFIGCKIYGEVRANNAHFASLKFIDSQIAKISMSESTVDGSIEFVRSNIGAGNAPSFVARGTIIKGSLLADSSKPATKNVFDGEVIFELCDVSRKIDFAGSIMKGSNRSLANGNTDKVAFSLTRSKCGGTFRLRGATVEGAIRGVGLQVQGQLNLTNIQILNTSGRSILFERSNIGSSVLLRQATLEGIVSFAGSKIAGGFYIAGSRISGNTELSVLKLDSVITQSVKFGGAKTVNDPDLSQTIIDGDVSMHSIEVQNDLVLNETVINRKRDGLDLSSSVIKGRLSAKGMKVLAPEYDKSNTVAIHAEGMTVTGPIMLDSSCLEGGVRFDYVEASSSVSLQGCFNQGVASTYSFVGARISQDLDFSALSSEKGNLLLDAVTISGTLHLRNVTGDPGISLEGSLIHELNDDEQSWPSESRLILRGLKYEKFREPISGKQELKRRLNWVAKQSDFTADPYEYLASKCSENSNSSAANRVMLELKNQEIKMSKFGVLRALKRLWFWISGFGYRISGLVVIAIFVLFFSILSAWFAQEYGLVIPSAGEEARSQITGEMPSAGECQSTYPCFDPVMYGIDAVVPVIEFHQRQYWVPDLSTTGGRVFDKLLFSYTLLGWVTLTVAAGGVVKRMRA